MIPKIIHQFWDGPKQRPSELMDEWKSAYTSAGWRYLLWNSTDLLRLNSGNGLANSHQFEEMPQWSGKCNIARYEILYELGGIYIDADTKFLRLIDERLLEQDSFCCYENEIIRPGLASNAYLGCSPQCELMEMLIKKISNLHGPSLHSDHGKEKTSKVESWITTGPVLLTSAIQEQHSRKTAVLPSFYFIPNHYLTSHPAAKYKGRFKPFGISLWGSTPGSSFNYAEEKQIQPIASICTITNNRKEFIPLLLKCIENQDYPADKMEWVILDDSSEYLENLDIQSETTLKIKYQRLSTKLTLGEKRNIAHKLCSGDIIVYMDDDDYYPPSRVSHAVRTLQSSRSGIAASTILPIYFTHDNQLWVSGPFGRNHGTAGTFAMTREFARNHHYSNNATCNEEKEFLDNYTIPVAQLDPESTMICISHSHNTFDKRKMRTNGPTPRMRPAKQGEFAQLLSSFSPLDYISAAKQSRNHSTIFKKSGSTVNGSIQP